MRRCSLPDAGWKARLLTSVFAALIVSPLSAQSAARATNAQSWRPATDTIAVTVEFRDKKLPMATAIKSLRPTTRAGRQAVELTYQWRRNDGSATADTVWIDAQTLAPIENHRHNGLQDGVTTFERSSAH